MRGLLKKLPWWQPHHPVIAANRAAFKRFDQSRPLADYSFVVFDTELTGLDQRRDEIVAIGGVRIDSLQIDLAQTFHCYVRPQRLDHTDATLVHRITPEQLRQAPPLAEVLPSFVDFVGSDLLVGHCIDLDMSFIHRATRQVYGGTLVNPGIDTIRLAQGYKQVIRGHYEEPGMTSTSYRLEDLSREFDLPLFAAHDALEDALQTAYLFLFLIKKFRKGGLTTLQELYRAGKPGIMQII